ncbi:hypothetical protein Tco_1444166 [Tanacetum coccineum]
MAVVTATAVTTTVAESDSEKGEDYPLAGGGDPNRQIVARKGARDFRFKMEAEVVSEVYAHIEMMVAVNW